MLRKIITYFLILAVVMPVLASAVPLGAGVNRAQAAGATKGNGGGSIEDPCGAFSATNAVLDAAAAITSPFRYEGSVWDCFSYTIVNILYTFVMNTSILIAGWASNLFNVSIQFSLTGESFDADKNIMIEEGWTLVRDLLNLVFIFILLFAAISTILQHGGFEIKKVLPSLIVVALLVNFSMLITKMVIDASHIFAWEFYNQIDVTDGGNVPNLKNSVNVDKDFVKKDLAAVFLAGFNPQRLLIGGKTETAETAKGDAKKETEKSPWKQVLEKATREGETLPSTLWRMAVIILFESALAIFAAFILLAGAIMFIIRVVVLWLVIIFSPIAFLGMILPNMKEYSGMWWKYLIGQSFFAPAFLFMFMLATKFINSKLIDSLLKITENDSSKIVTGLNMGEIVLISFNFLIVGGIMMACLVVARKLGAETAQYGIKWAHKGKELALGATRYGINNRGTRYLGGTIGDSNWFAQSIGRIPGGGMLGRKLGAMKKADEDKMRKAAEKYAGTLSSAGRKSLAREIEGTKGVGGFVKRFAYTGPEGAFAPGKEGYQNIIAKKKAEEEKKKRIKEEERELETLNKALPKMGPIKEHQKERLKEIEKDLEEFDVEIKAADYELAEAVKSKNISKIDKAKQKLKDVKKEPKLLGLKMEKKVREEKIKTIEKHEARKESLQEKKDRRKETEGLQEAIKTSGSGAGGGTGTSGGGGGGKTP